VGNWRAPDDQTYDVNVRLARGAHHARRTWSACPLPWRRRRRQRIVRLNQVPRWRSTGPSQINRRDLTREVAINANVYCARPARCRPTSAGAGQHRLPPGYRYQFGGSTKNMAESFGYAMSALAWPSSSST
jgi:HAE1 family hydrophobic/amphiphilic exporter-1